MKFSQVPITKVSKARSRFSVWLSLLLLCSLLAHSFDACAAHIALPEKPSPTAVTSDCPQPVVAQTTHVCCSHPAQDAPDLCEITSEVSTAPTHGFQLDAPDVIASSPVALLAEFFVLLPPPGALRSRDGPDVPSLVSLCLSHSLSGRSPPFRA